jgi:hypothetical protein
MGGIVLAAKRRLGADHVLAVWVIRVGGREA